MTQTAQVIGTAQYLSPEQARGERVDARSDLYSTGCLLYELLTGRPPFIGDSPVAVAYQHVRENPVPPSRVDPEIPPWADAIVLKAMAKNPARPLPDRRRDAHRHPARACPACRSPRRARWATRHPADGPGGTTMAGADRAIPGYEYGPEEGDYTEGGGGTRRRTWLWWALGALLVLAVLGGAGLRVLRRQRRRGGAPGQRAPGHSRPPSR